MKKIDAIRERANNHAALVVDTLAQTGFALGASQETKDRAYLLKLVNALLEERRAKAAWLIELKHPSYRDVDALRETFGRASEYTQTVLGESE